MPADEDRRCEAAAGERLQKVLARAGVASRRRCEELITAGRVTVNGQVVRALGSRVDAERDRIAVDGRPLAAERPRLYYLLYKPVGHVSAASDPQGRPTAVSLAPTSERLYPVGRLDLESEGLLLLTNDGALAQRLLHPRYGHAREYLALVRGRVDAAIARRLASGVTIGRDDPAAPEGGWLVRAHARPAADRFAWRGEPAPPGCQWVWLRVHEGRKRQLRLMLAEVGRPVLRLIRTRMGPLTLGDLQPGEGRWLDADEAAALRAALHQPAPARNETEEHPARDHHRHRRPGRFGQEHGRRCPG